MCSEYDKKISDNLRAMAIQCVRALASDSAVQIRVYPEFVPVIDELRRDLPDVLSLIEGCRIPKPLSDSEKKQLQELDILLANVRDPGPAESDQSDEEILNSVEWTEIRSRASEIIDLNGWQGPLNDELPHKF